MTAAQRMMDRQRQQRQRQMRRAIVRIHRTNNSFHTSAGRPFYTSAGSRFYGA